MKYLLRFFAGACFICRAEAAVVLIGIGEGEQG